MSLKKLLILSFSIVIAPFCFSQETSILSFNTYFDSTLFPESKYLNKSINIEVDNNEINNNYNGVLIFSFDVDSNCNFVNLKIIQEVENFKSSLITTPLLIKMEETMKKKINNCTVRKSIKISLPLKGFKRN